MKDHIVYALLDPRDEIEFYIGISGVKGRPKRHFIRGKKNHPKWNVIQKLRREGVRDADMIRILVRNVSRAEAGYLEVCLIAFLGRRSTGEGPLTNLTAGDDANPHDDPIAHRRQLRAMRKLHTPEFRARHS